MDVGILGPLLVREGDHETTIGAAKPRALFVLLVLHRADTVSTEALVDALWDGRPPATATKVVHGYVSQLRRSLGAEAVETRPGGYRLQLGAEGLDADRFTAMLGRGQSLLADGNAEQASVVLRQALALWRGPALVEFRSQDFAANEARRLDELRLLARECRLEAELALGRHARVVPELAALVREHPLREQLSGLLMLALYRSGRQADALAAYQATRYALAEELGIDPGQPLQRLQAAILSQDPGLELVAAPRPGPDRATVAPPPGRLDRTGHPRDRTPAPDVSAGSRPARTGPPRRQHRHAHAAVAAVALVTMGILVLPARDDAPARTATLSVDSVGFVSGRNDQVSRQISLSGAPTALAAGMGSVWVVSAASNMVARIDPQTRAVVQTVPVGLDPGGIGVGGGSVWVANHDDDTVSRISPETGAVVQTVPVGAGPVAVAFGDGSAWVTNGDDRTLTRIDGSSGAVTATIRTNAVGQGIAVGGGEVWVTDEASSRVLAVDPATDTVAAQATVGTGPTGVAYGAGSVWVVNALDGTVSRVDPATMTVRSTVAVPGGPSSVGVAGGTVWVTEEFATALARIDPSTGQISGTTSVGNRPDGLTATGSGVWVGVQAAATGHRGGRLVVTGGEVGSIDPAVGDLVPELSEPVYDGLTTLRRVGAGTQVVSDLAVALPQPTDGGTSYTFRLRPGLRYSNGRPVLAADFERAAERSLVLGGDAAQGLSGVLGAAACTAASHCDLSAGVVVQGASTITFRLKAPDPSLVEDLAVLFPVPAGTPMRDVGTSAVPGTGPYAIEAFVPGRLVTFDRNRFFHVWSDAARPDGYPDEIVYRAAADGAAAMQAVTAGRADLVELASEPPHLSEVTAEHPRQVHLVDEQALIFAFLNVRQPPFDDLRVRRAVNDAVDRDRAAAIEGPNTTRPACQLVPPTSSGYRAYCPYTVDPDPQGRWAGPDLATARSLVQASGTSGQAVVVWAGPVHAALAQYLVSVLDRLGYRASVRVFPGPDAFFATLARTPTAQAGIFAFLGGDPLAVTMLSSLTCGFTPNPAHFCDPAIDAQVRLLAQQEPTDPAGTADLAATIEREITDQAPWVPLFTRRSAYVTSTRVGNFQASAGQVPLDQLWVR